MAASLHLAFHPSHLNPRTIGFPSFPLNLLGRNSSSTFLQPRRSMCQSSSNDAAAPGNGRPPPARRGVRIVSSPSTLGDGADEKFFATCAPGLEQVVAAELRAPSIGASRVEVGSAGVAFRGSKSTGVRANLWLRSAVRVLLELSSGPLPRRGRSDPVYAFVRHAADWPSLLVRDGHALDGATKFRSFSVNCRVHDCEGVSSSLFASTRAKDAICDALKDACKGRRPDPPQDEADVPLFVSLFRDWGIVYRDMSGVSLHKRGYRDAKHRAGLNEAVAAGVLTIAGWNGSLPEFGRRRSGDGNVLLDPMCGSGTFLIEAALMALNRAPGLMRSHWPFETWHDFGSSTLRVCRDEAVAAEVPGPNDLRLLGNDIHEGALSLCDRDAKAANVRSMMDLSFKDCSDFLPSEKPSLVVVNPPWGGRIDSSGAAEEGSLLETWQSLGRFLKSSCNETDVYVLSGNSQVTRALHMKADKKWVITVGGVDCRLMHYYVLPAKGTCDVKSLSCSP